MSIINSLAMILICIYFSVFTLDIGIVSCIALVLALQSSRCVSHVCRGIRLAQSLIISSKKDETFDSVLFHISLLKCVECSAVLW